MGLKTKNLLFKDIYPHGNLGLNMNHAFLALKLLRRETRDYDLKMKYKLFSRVVFHFFWRQN